MRFYIYCQSDEPTVEPYILAEVVRDETNDRSLSLAASLSGPRSLILTRSELSTSPERRRALERWDLRDDSVFEDESVLLARNGRVAVGGRGSVRLHTVDPDTKEPAKDGNAILPLDPRLREVILISRGLRDITRQAVQRARALQIEMGDNQRDNGGKAHDEVG
jgi:hypothetical protein